MFDTRTTDGKFDTQAIKATVNMLALVESDLGPCKRHNGQWHFWPCPFHAERTASFAVNPSTRSWRCFGACQESGFAIEWVQKYKKLGFKDTCRYLEGFMHSQPAVSTPRPPVAKVQCGPSKAVWQSSALALVNKCQRSLWQASAAANALAYLHERGLNDETIRSAQLGYNTGHREERTAWGLAHDDYSDYVWIDNGIVIPFLANGIPQRITIRKFPKIVTAAGEELKYKILSGSANTLYNGHQLVPSRPAILTEGVFDALSVQQQAGDLLVSVATDSTGGARTPEWIDKLAVLPLLLLAFDADEAGDTASEFWLEKLPNARRLRPSLDDPNAMLQAGMNLRSWVQNALS